METLRISTSLRFLCRLAVMACAVAGTCDGCRCAPQTFFGPVRVLTTTVGPGMPDTRVDIFMTGYDAVHKRVAVNYPEPGNVYTRSILDFGKSAQFIVTGTLGQNKCTRYPLPTPWREACVPANATESDAFYMGHATGQYQRQMDARAYTLTQGAVRAKVMVTTDVCALVGEVIYDSSDKAGVRVINRLYVNQTTYPNDEFFKLPPNITCVNNPDPAPTTLWQRIGLFGWLMALPEN